MKANTNKTKYTVRAAMVVLVFVFMSSFAAASEITSDNVIRYVNLAREAQGLNDLRPNEKLMQAAKDKLDDMIENNYFAHTSPSGVNPWYWFQKENYDYHYAGENLAINFTTAEGQQEAWMKSPTHRKNILDPSYQEIGVAIGTKKIDGQISIIAVQEFGATFAGIQADAKNFSPFKNSDLKTDDGKVVPQVLSTKNISSEKVTGNNSQIDSEKLSERNGISAIEKFFNVAFAVLMLSIALMAMVFLAVAADKSWLILENIEAKEKAQSMN